MHKKIIIGVLLFATIFLFANCVPENNNSESLSELTNEFNIYYDKSIIQHYTSSNKISRLFLDSFYKSGLDLKMDDERYEYFIKTALSPGGVSAYDLGYLYKYENLKGYEYAHGVIGFGIIRSLSEIN